MSKKITSFLVLAIAVLLALPTQAQTSAQTTKAALKKVAATGVQGQMKSKKSATSVAQFADAQATTQAKAVEAKTDAAVERTQKLADNTVGKSFRTWNWAAHETPKFVSKNTLLPVGELTLTHKGDGRFLATQLVKAHATRGPNRAAATDAHGIITEPDEGETKYYTRTGTALYNNNNSVYSQPQDGRVTIVYGNDGAVYIKDPISLMSTGAWVKATKDGNTLSVAGGQPIYWSDQYNAAISVSWGTRSGNSYPNRTDAGEDITFTIDEAAGTITLNNSNENHFIGAYWDDDNSFNGYGDYETVLTIDNDYVAPSTELIELPEGAEVEEWFNNGQTVVNNAWADYAQTTAKVAIVGNEVYLAGLSSDFPDAWFKGTIEGETVTFPSIQYVGKVGTYDIFVSGSNGLYQSSQLEDFKMTYDAEKQTLTAQNTLIYNAASDRIYWYSAYQDVVLSKDEPDHGPVLIDALPYSNNFDETDAQKEFTIIDANEDGKTFSFYTEANNTVKVARYNLNSNKDADDWLVSPGIKLVAGKKYSVAFDVRVGSASYPEKFEVKAAKENTVEALSAGQTLLAEAEYKNTDFVSFGNGEFTVSETGYYFIGIHATSAKDMYYLDIDNFAVEAAPVTAPYTADFTQEAFFNDFSVLDVNSDGSTWRWTANNGAYYTYHNSNKADDYLILPIKLEANKNYNVIVNAAAQGTTSAEKFEVKAGKVGTPEGLNITAISEQTVDKTEYNDFEGSFTTDEEGIWYVAIHATSDADKYYLKVRSFTIEAGAEDDAPAAVNDFTVTPGDNELKATINFNAPTKAINGDDLAADGITKIEILRDGNVINTIENAEPGKAYSYVDADASLTIGTHKYQAITYGASGIGGKSEEVSVFLSATLTVPYVADFSQAGTFDAFQVIDNNADNTTWAWTASNFLYYSYSGSNKADDYVVTSPIQLQAGKSYLVTVAAHSYNATYPEKFEVVYGTEATAEGLSNVAIAETEVKDGNTQDFEGEFSVPADGIYYVAIHALSEADMWRLTVEKFSIEVGADPAAPAAADLSAEAGAEGALEVNLSFNAPANAINGSALTGTEDIKIYRNDVLVNTLEGVAPGSAQTWKDTDVEDGETYTYYIVASNEAGDGQKSQKVSVYVGQDELDKPAFFDNAGQTDNSLSFKWGAAQGKNGGYINLSQVQYNVKEYELQSNGWFQYLNPVQTLGTKTAEYEGTFDYDNTGAQKLGYFGAQATLDGENETDIAYTLTFTGVPYEVPFVEPFNKASGGLAYPTWLYDVSDYDNVSANWGEENSDADGSSWDFINNGGADQWAHFTPGKVKVSTAANPTLLFDGKSDVATFSAYAEKANGEQVDLTLEAEEAENGFKTYKAKLTQFASEPYIFVYVQANFTNDGDAFVDNFKILDLLEQNLSVKVSAPKSVKAGEKAAITVTVKNEGEQATADDYTVKVTADGKTLFEETVSEALASFATKEFAAELETTIFDDAADVTITASVDYVLDLNEDNNTAETIVSIKESSAAQPENLTAEVNEQNVTLNWTAPEDATEEVKETFESYNDGAWENGEIGEWTVVNNNGWLKGGFFTDFAFPYDNQAGSFMVINLAQNTGLTNEMFTAPEGSQAYLASGCNIDPNDEENYPDNDDWAISPVLPGVAQTITFDVKNLYNTQYSFGEAEYEILASSTDTELSSFTKVAGALINFTDNAWHSAEAELPAGTKYFAIRNVTDGDNALGFFVGNIVYLQGGGEVEGYNIYRDGEKIATVEGGVTTYTDENLEAGEYEFAVSALYAGGVESKPVTVTAVVAVPTGINQIVNSNNPADVFTIDGKLVRKQANSLSGLKGIYVVNGKTVILK